MQKKFCHLSKTRLNRTFLNMDTEFYGAQIWESDRYEAIEGT